MAMQDRTEVNAEGVRHETIGHAQEHFLSIHCVNVPLSDAAACASGETR
jgi:hypothetical protein